MNAVKIKALYPGQVVAIQNDRRTGTVVKRVANGRYLVSFAGRQIEMFRTQLAVNVLGMWVSGPKNEQKSNAAIGIA